jgi:hypothetical protein
LDREKLANFRFGSFSIELREFRALIDRFGYLCLISMDGRGEQTGQLMMNVMNERRAATPILNMGGPAVGGYVRVLQVAYSMNIVSFGICERPCGSGAVRRPRLGGG